MKIKQWPFLVCAASLVGVAVVLGTAGLAQGGSVINGDFDDTAGWGAVGTLDGPPGWSVGNANNAQQQSGANAIGGTGTSALMVPAAGTIYQSFAETPSQWQLDMDFASVDSGASGDRSLTGSIFNGADVLLTYRVNGDGDFQLFERGGASWHTPSGLAGAVIFDNDVTTTPLTHSLRITGNFDLSVPNYDVRITDSSSNIHESLGLTSWNKPIVGGVGVGPTTGQGITMFDLPTTLSNGEYLVDNVAVTFATLPYSFPVGESQLFVDDGRVAARNGVVRTAHAAQKLDQPVLEAEMPWETDGWDKRIYLYGTVHYDEAQSQFRMWYMARPNGVPTVAYATSQDGINWERPNLGLVDFEGSTENNLLPIPYSRFESLSVIYDELETDPAKRYKMAGVERGGAGYTAAYSEDGINWNKYPNPILPGGDTSTLAQNPETGEYLFFFKKTLQYRGALRRLVYLTTSMDMENWSAAELVMAPDAIDDAQTQDEGGINSQFYNMSVFWQGGQFLGLVTHFRYSGPPEETGPGQSSWDGPIDVQIVSSRDGHTWERNEDRSPVIANGPYAYDAGTILGVANTPVNVGDEQWIYYTSINTEHGGFLPDKEITISRAVWRRDGFVSLDADSGGGTIVTVPFELQAQNLFINATTIGDGSIRIELLDDLGAVIPGYALDDSSLFSGDSVQSPITWSAQPIGADLIGETVSLRFYLQDASLYSFLFLETPPGDFDLDGDVDGADFLLWQVGDSPNPHSASDLAIWENNYGFTSEPFEAGSTIPEPATLSILSSLLLFGLFRRHGQ